MFDFLLEFILTFWLEMASAIIPQHETAKRVAKIIVVGVIVLVFAGFTAGAIMLTADSPHKNLALILIITSAAIVFLQTFLGLLVYLKRK